MIGKLLFKDYLILGLLITLPFLVYVHCLFPEEKNIILLGININSGYYLDVNYVSWIFFSKLSIISLLIMWLLTINHWWRYTIIVPIVIEIYKVLSLFNTNYSYIDENEYILSLPITIPLVILFIFIAKKINYYNNRQRFILELNKELDETLISILEIKKINKNKVQLELRILKSRKDYMSKDEYIHKLIELRNKLITF